MNRCCFIFSRGLPPFKDGPHPGGWQPAFDMDFRDECRIG
jgi:hypothetical protein